MFRALMIFLLLGLAAPAANVKLYLTDGTFHIVSEYEVKEDRVRFYTVERSQWEEIPLELIDLERTEREVREREEARKEELEFWDREEAAERAQQREIARVPMASGVYWVEKDEAHRLPQAELDVKSDKKRTILQVITPVPVFTGKKSVYVSGPRAEMVFDDPTPEFYIRLFQLERFGIIRLKPEKERRLVETWVVAPVTNEVAETHDAVEVFRREVGDGLFKIWPKEPLEPGEYAVVEFSSGEANVQAWDFGYYPRDAESASKPSRGIPEE